MSGVMVWQAAAAGAWKRGWVEAGEHEREAFFTQLESTAVAVGTAQARRLALQQLSVLVQEVAHMQPTHDTNSFMQPASVQTQRSYKLQPVRLLLLAVSAVCVQRTAV
jgi:hypothetical protein